MASSQASEAACKREMLYHKWSSRVFSPLHTQITKVMGGGEFKNMEREKRTLFQNYINYCNKQVELRRSVLVCDFFLLL